MASEYIVEAHSRLYFQDIAWQIRGQLGLENQVYFPIVETLDWLSLIYGFTYEIVEDGTLPPFMPADMNPETGEIRLESYVYCGAATANGTHRMTITHEFAHYITLCYLGFKWHKNDTDEEVPAYCSPEWQAKCLAGELLVPFKLTQHMSCEEIMETCVVSREAAVYQYYQIHKEDLKMNQ